MFSSTPPSAPLYHISLLRHGESTGNAEGRFQGQSDFPLSQTGTAQAQSLAAHWRAEGITFDQIIASPLKRAHQTAEIIAGVLGSPVELEPLWMERNNGRFAGLRVAEANGLFPPDTFIHPYRRVGETGETQLELFLRAGQGLQSLLHRPPGCYLVVSHGGILNMALFVVLGIAPTPITTGPRFRFSNTSFATLTYNPYDHVWRVLGLNDRAHWTRPEPAHERDAAPEIHIRQATASDIDSLCDLVRVTDVYHRQQAPHIYRPPDDPQSTCQHIAEVMADPNAVFFLAEIDRKPAGLALVRLMTAPDIPVLQPRRYASVDNLVTSPDFRRQGVGEGLMQACISWAREQGLPRLELNVWDFNQPAVRLYEKLGLSVQTMRMAIDL